MSFSPSAARVALQTGVLTIPRPVLGLRMTDARLRVILVLSAALWGIVVDTNAIPVLSPTGNSTIFQATTAAPFALIGIVFGPFAGAAAGFVRDGTSYLVTLMVHPDVLRHQTVWHWSGRASADIFEDVVLGWVPGLVALRSRRLSLLVAASAVTTWLSLPFLVVANTLIDGELGGVWQALGTPVGDWDEPVDPGLTVYALLTAAIVALALARWSTRPRGAVLLGAALAAAGGIMIGFGAHP